MTLNVPVNQQGVPLALPGEYFFLFRNNIEFQVKIQGVGKKTLNGTAFLTTFRIVFVSQKPSADFWSFDIPIHLLYSQSVQFPLFGSTYLKGSSYPYQSMLPGNSQFKLWFKNGGCDTFIRILSNLIKQVRSFNKNQQVFMQNSKMYNDIRTGNFNFKAFVDPNDPSQVFAQQPKTDIVKN